MLNRRKLLIVLIIILVALGVGLYMVFGNNSPASTEQRSSKTTSQQQGSSSSRSDDKSQESQSTSKNNPQGTPADSATKPMTPTGGFVSNHRPNLSGSPAPNAMNSICQTTPGASCTIRFTMNGETKSLPSKTTGADGYASWDWKLQDLGITEGTWSVEAVATTSGGNTSATDATNLEVKP